jgi:hypothetical protein
MRFVEKVTKRDLGGPWRHVRVIPLASNIDKEQCSAPRFLLAATVAHKVKCWELPTAVRTRTFSSPTRLCAQLR